MKIEQVRIASAVKFFAGMLTSKYALHPYTDRRKPALFFGCYGDSAVRSIQRHEALVVMIWAGSDAKYISKGRYDVILRKKNVRHVAISRFISEDLIRCQIPHIHLPICPTHLELFNPQPLGDAVYVYCSKKWPQTHGGPLVKRLQRSLPSVPFIVTHIQRSNSTPYCEMPTVYRRCCLGLRLTAHDGLSNTAVELGLMGRRCVWNGWLPNAIPWSGIKGIVRAIHQERTKVGTTDNQLVRSVREFLRLPSGWLDTRFYG